MRVSSLRAYHQRTERAWDRRDHESEMSEKTKKANVVSNRPKVMNYCNSLHRSRRRRATLWDPYTTRASGERAWVGAQLYMFGIRIPKPQAPRALGKDQ